MRQAIRVIVLTVVTTMMVGAVSVGMARAGGSWFDPVADRYEPGETATLVGYSGGGVLGTTADGPFYGYLFKAMEDLSVAPRAIPLPLGEMEVTATGQVGQFAIRATISFQIPDWVSPGTYRFEYCNAGCENQLGELIGGFLFIGVDPEFDIAREWPWSEPEIANLATEALLVSLGSTVTAGEMQSSILGRRLSDQYKTCVRGAGFTDELGAQVLLTDSAEPYHVKTSPEVPSEFHGPCLRGMGGPPTSGSSWDLASGVCYDSIPILGCALRND